MSSSAWSFGAAPSSYFMSTANPKNAIWPGRSKVPTPFDITYDQMTHTAIPVSTLDMQPRKLHPGRIDSTYFRFYRCLFLVTVKFFVDWS